MWLEYPYEMKPLPLTWNLLQSEIWNHLFQNTTVVNRGLTTMYQHHQDQKLGNWGEFDELPKNYEIKGTYINHKKFRFLIKKLKALI